MTHYTLCRDKKTQRNKTDEKYRRPFSLNEHKHRETKAKPHIEDKMRQDRKACENYGFLMVTASRNLRKIVRAVSFVRESVKLSALVHHSSLMTP